MVAIADQEWQIPPVPERSGDGIVTRRRFIGVGAGAFVAAILAACGTTSTTPTTGSAASSAPAASAAPTAVSGASSAPSAAASAAPTTAPSGKKGGESHGAWPYPVPPEGHFNSINGIPKRILSDGLYRDILEMPLGMLYWQESKYTQLLATDWKFDGDNFRVTLRKGVKWSDGKDFGPQDVITTFTLLRLLRQPVWNFIDEVKADGDSGVVFHMNKPSSVVERYVIRENMRSDATFGEWSKKVQDIFTSGKTTDSNEFKQLNQDFQQFRPKEMITTGPFKIDASSLTNAQVTLTKVPTSWVADKVAFDKVVIYNGETPDITPVVLARDVDYATHGFPPATEEAFKGLGLRIVRPPTYSGAALIINFDKLGPVFGDKKVRQALAYAINRPQNAQVTYGESGGKINYMAGIADTLVPQWLSADDVKKLNTYPYDTKKAEQLLTEAGWKKGGDGSWTTKDGTKVGDYEVVCAAEYADHSASAQDVADQLTKFGIKTAVRTINFAQVDTDVWKGNFQLAIRTWGSSTQPHPQFSYDQGFLYYNAGRAANAGGKGMNFPLKQTTDTVGDVDLEQLTIQSGQGTDAAAQKAAVTKIALAFNELLPMYPLYERFGNNPVLDNGSKLRVVGWPKDDDVILKNSAYADSFVTMKLLDGSLKPA